MSEAKGCKLCGRGEKKEGGTRGGKKIKKAGGGGGGYSCLLYTSDAADDIGQV